MELNPESIAGYAGVSDFGGYLGGWKFDKSEPWWSVVKST